MKNLLKAIILLILLLPHFDIAHPNNNSANTNLKNLLTPNAKRIRKITQSIPASKETVAFFEEILKDYDLDPSKYKILRFNDPNNPSPAIANSEKNCVYVNEAICTYASWDTDDYNNLNSIWLGYHEVGHLKDMSQQKISLSRGKAFWSTFLSSSFATAGLSYFGTKLLDAKVPNSLLAKVTWIGGSVLIGLMASALAAKKISDTSEQKATQASEQRADTLACKQLLKKEWGPKAILACMFNLTLLSTLHAEHPETKSISTNMGHDPEAELNNLKNVLAALGYRIDYITSPETNQLTLQLKENDSVKHELILPLPN